MARSDSPDKAAVRNVLHYSRATCAAFPDILLPDFEFLLVR